nr:hypothetical protein BAR15_120156 [Bartonella sp. AR 15-3]
MALQMKRYHTKIQYNETNISGRDAANFIRKGIGLGKVHHNIPANNAQRKKNKISIIMVLI